MEYIHTLLQVLITFSLNMFMSTSTYIAQIKAVPIHKNITQKHGTVNLYGISTHGMIVKKHRFTYHQVFRHIYHSLHTGILLIPTHNIIFNICYQTNQFYAHIHPYKVLHDSTLWYHL